MDVRQEKDGQNKQQEKTKNASPTLMTDTNQSNAYDQQPTLYQTFFRGDFILTNPDMIMTLKLTLQIYIVADLVLQW